MQEKKASAIYLHALTPVHAGTGQASASVVDLPIAREKATHWPVLPATSLKGVLKSEAKSMISAEEHIRLFGREAQQIAGKQEDTIAGKLQFGDARLLCFPVRSWQGVFAYVTCPLALNRLRRDFSALGVPVPFDEEDTILQPADEEALIPNGGSLLVEKDKIWLEDLELAVKKDKVVQAIADGIARAVFPAGEQQDFVQHFALLPDNLFDFLTETATEITARIKLNDDTKTVDKDRGALWYEEAVPAEAIFVAPVLGGDVPLKGKTVVQIGGNESVGRGLCRVTVTTK